jgi:diguanylate cyclase (GGDEF)-like protein
MRIKFGFDDSGEATGGRPRLATLSLAVLLVAVLGIGVVFTNLAAYVQIGLASVAGDIGWLMPAVGLAVAAALLGALYIAVSRGKVSIPMVSAGEPGDSLAQLQGRDALLRALAAEIDEHADSGRQLALHLVDIDRFGVLNDVLGETEGDAFLRGVAERLLALVNQPERVARIGDDEFAVIQPEAGGSRHAEIYAKRIQETLDEVCRQIPSHARPGVTVGVAVSPDHGRDAGALLHSASLALHAGKAAGGGTIRVFGRDAARGVEERAETEKAIVDGLQQGWFSLHFQPQYDIRSRRLTGFEALVRMTHPEKGELPPAAFLPAAEQSGLIQRLGEWIIRDALTHAALWPKHLTLSLNVSTAQFRHCDIAATLLQGMSNCDVEGERVRVELSEALLRDQSAAIEEQLRRLKSHGVSLVLDDFGIETTSLRALATSPCDAVKLDRTVVQALGEDSGAQKLARGLMGAARAFRLDVLAEGVERPEQMAFLMANFCYGVQGFLFGRPVPASEVAAIIAKDMRKHAAGEEAGRATSAVEAA